MLIDSLSIKHLLNDIKTLSHTKSDDLQHDALNTLLSIEIDNSDTYMADNLFDDIRRDILSDHFKDALYILEPLYSRISKSKAQ